MPARDIDVVDFFRLNDSSAIGAGAVVSGPVNVSDQFRFFSVVEIDGSGAQIIEVVDFFTIGDNTGVVQGVIVQTDVNIPDSLLIADELVLEKVFVRPPGPPGIVDSTDGRFIVGETTRFVKVLNPNLLANSAVWESATLNRGEDPLSRYHLKRVVIEYLGEEAGATLVLFTSGDGGVTWGSPTYDTVPFTVQGAKEGIRSLGTRLLRTVGYDVRVRLNWTSQKRIAVTGIKFEIVEMPDIGIGQR